VISIRISKLLSAVLSLLLLLAEVVPAQTPKLVTDFEPAAGYAPGQDIGGVDGWIAFSGTRGLIMPDPNSGYMTVLDGSQSYVIWGNGAYGRGFGTASSAVTAGSTLSWLWGFEADAGPGGSGVYLSNNVAGGQTPAGVETDDATNTFSLFGLGGSTATGVGFSHSSTYRIDMELDFVNQRFEAFATDLTLATPRTSLGTKLFGQVMKPAATASSGGVVLNRSGGSASYYDRIEVTAGTTPTEDPADPGFGKQWVRQNPFTIFAVPTGEDRWAATGGLTTYENTGFTTAWTYGWDRYVTDEASPAGMPWHAYVPAQNPYGAAGYFDAIRTIPGGTAYMIGDEPSRAEMESYALTLKYVKSQDPNVLTYVNAFPIYASQAQLRGDSSGTPYAYDQYVRDIMDIVKPDVLMYDYYPFHGGTTDYNGYFYNMKVIRDEALARDVPYWAWAQSWGGGGARLPSESELRMQLFSHLTAGYTGVGYWTYTRYAAHDTGLFDANNQPTPLLAAAADANREIENLGNVLRFAQSTDLRFVQGSHSAPGGLSNWTLGAGGDSHLLSIIVGAGGSYRNGLIGFFEDDNGELLFMLTNLNQSSALSAEGAALTFILQFDSSVTGLFHLDRETGLQEMIALNAAHQLVISIPGGTGELFKYTTGNFIPEPASLALLGMSGGLLLARRRRH
jgi:hypothetical protein